MLILFILLIVPQNMEIVLIWNYFLTDKKLKLKNDVQLLG